MQTIAQYIPARCRQFCEAAEGRQLRHDGFKFYIYDVEFGGEFGEELVEESPSHFFGVECKDLLDDFAITGQITNF